MDIELYNKASNLRRLIGGTTVNIKKLSDALEGITNMKDEVELRVPETWKSYVEIKVSKNSYKNFIESELNKNKADLADLNKEFYNL